MNTFTSLAGLCFNAPRRTCWKSQDTNNKGGIVLGMTSISTKKSIAVISKNPQSRRSSVIPFFPSLNLVHSYRLVIELILHQSRLISSYPFRNWQKNRGINPKKSSENIVLDMNASQLFFWINSLKFDGESSRRFAYTGHISGIYSACIGRVLKANDGLIKASYNLYWNCNVNTGRFLTVNVWKVVFLDSSLYTRTEMTLIC